jgi:monoamine oxidase
LLVADVVVVGGGFAGLVAARELERGGLDVLLVEARERLGGRAWAAPWGELEVEYGAGWVHWHQPFAWSEIVKAGLAVERAPAAERAGWYVDGERRVGSAAERDEVLRRGWDRFVEGVEEALPLPHDPHARREKMLPFDRLSIAERIGQLELPQEEHDVLWAELEALAHGPIEEAGAMSVLRWHALAGYRLELAQLAGGFVSIRGGTGALARAIAPKERVETRLGPPVACVRQASGRVEVEPRAGEGIRARACVVALPLNALSGIAFEPALSEAKREAIARGQASRGIKIFIRARGPRVTQSAIRPGHPFGYLATEELLDGDEQLLIGFGPDAGACEAGDLRWVNRELAAILPGYEARGATAHDWLRDEFSRGTWAIHRPGWYGSYHEEMRRPEGRVALAGSDIADGWSGFIDGAIESGFRAASAARALLAGAP